MADKEINSCRDRLSEFKISEGEVNQLRDALKHEEFRKLLIEYAKEMNDPKIRERHESELIVYEREQGFQVEIIEPVGNYVVKTCTTSGDKVMINICTALKVGEPQCELHADKKHGQQWQIPYIVGSNRQEMDRKKQVCTVIDILFNERTLQLAQNSPALRKLVHDTALEASESSLKMKLNKSHLKFPKLKYKGLLTKCIIRTAIKQSPSYEFVYQENSFRVKTALIVKIKLPLLSSVTDCCLDVTDSILSLNHESYNLNINLPMKVNSDKGKATFDNVAKLLAVELPTYENTDSAPNKQLVEVGDGAPVDMVNNNTGDLSPESTDYDKVKNLSADKIEHHNINKAVSENIHGSVKETNPGDNVGGDAKASTDLSINNNYWLENDENVNTENKIKANLQQRQQALKMRSFSESSDDWSVSRSHSPCKGILKSSLCGDVYRSLERTTSLCEEVDSGLPCSAANTGSSSSSVKKSVSFSDVISKQLFRADSSILGQKKKNQRRARNKRKNQSKRTNSESEEPSSEPEASSAYGTSQNCMKPQNQCAEFSSDLMFDIDM